MSNFKAKNLTYEKSQPAFLQRLRAEFSGDRNNVQHSRPNKSRLKTGDPDEDEPTMVDEVGEGVSKEEYEAMLKREQGGEQEPKEETPLEEDGETTQATEEIREQQQVVEVGGVKKRKVGKIVGDFDETGELDKDSNMVKAKKGNAKKEEAGEGTSKPKKKAKKVKLSFDEPGD